MVVGIILDILTYASIYNVSKLNILKINSELMQHNLIPPDLTSFNSQVSTNVYIYTCTFPFITIFYENYILLIKIYIGLTIFALPLRILEKISLILFF